MAEASTPAGDNVAAAPARSVTSAADLAAGEILTHPTNGTMILVEKVYTVAAGDMVQVAPIPYRPRTVEELPESTIYFQEDAATARFGGWSILPADDPTTVKLTALSALTRQAQSHAWVGDGKDKIVLNALRKATEAAVAAGAALAEIETAIAAGDPR